MIIPDRHRLALRAALLAGNKGAEAFAEWFRIVPLDAVDHDEFRLLPLVYLRAAERDCTAPEMGRLKGVYRQVWVKNTLLLKTCASVVDLLQAAGIETLLLKGIAIFAQWAGAYGPRAMRDIDVLVPRGAARHAIHLLTQAGWTVKNFHMADFAEVDFDWRHGVTLYQDDGRELDLHWRALPRNTSPEHVEMFWSASQRIEVLGKNTSVLRVEDQLYLSLIHGARCTDGASLDWVVDAFVLLRSQPKGIDWSRLAEHAHRDRSVPAISRQFTHFHEVLGNPTPLMQIAKWRRTSPLDVMASRILEKSHDFLRPRARLFLEYHEFLIHNARPAKPSTLLEFMRERFVIQRTLYRMPKVLVRLFRRPLTHAFGRPSCLRETRRLPAIHGQIAWDGAQSPFLFGWSYPEINGRWTVEAEAILGFRDTSDRSTDLLATAEIVPYLTDGHQRLSVDVIVNGVPCGTCQISGRETMPATFEFIVPRVARRDPTRALLVTFIIKSPARPSEVAQSQDVRTLGFFFECIRFTNREHAKPLRARIG